jgi:hypothetical protein
MMMILIAIVYFCKKLLGTIFTTGILPSGFSPAFGCLDCSMQSIHERSEPKG